METTEKLTSPGIKNILNSPSSGVSGLSGLSEPEPTNGFTLERPSPPLSSLLDDKKKRWMRRVDVKEQKAQVAEMTVEGKIFPLALMASSCSLATRLSWRTIWQNREDPLSVIHSTIEKKQPVNHLPFEGAGKRSQEPPVKWRCQKRSLKRDDGKERRNKKWRRNVFVKLQETKAPARSLWKAPEPKSAYKPEGNFSNPAMQTLQWTFGTKLR